MIMIFLVMLAVSAERSAPVDAALDADAVLDAAEVAELAGAELLELEQAASSSAAPAAVIPNATRSARE
jgi:hypothetical protein